MAKPPLSGNTRLAALFGDPVAHSMSPALYNAAFEASGLDWVYVALRVAEANGVAAFEGAKSMGLSGLSVTMPLKQVAFEALDIRSPAVERLRAANCICIDNDRLVGHNTDGEGFLRGLAQDLAIDVSGMRVVVVGAGGAARAVIYAIARAGAEDVAVLNRTPSKAQVGAELGDSVGRVGDAEDLLTADLVVHATSLGMEAADPLPFDIDKLNPGAAVADLIYHPSPTRLMSAAKERGNRTTGGASMLLHQAAIAFELWTNTPAPLGAMAAVMVAR